MRLAFMSRWNNNIEGGMEYWKIDFWQRQAASIAFDICYIDKSNVAELSKAINSLFYSERDSLLSLSFRYV